jgi:hypothetical protein
VDLTNLDFHQEKKDRREYLQLDLDCNLFIDHQIASIGLV